MATNENIIHIFEDDRDLGDSINVDRNSLELGFQGMYYLKLSRNYSGVAVQIDVLSKVIKKSGKTAKVTKAEIIIDGLGELVSNSIELKT